MSSTTIAARAHGRGLPAQWAPRIGVVALVAGIALAFGVVGARSVPLALGCATLFVLALAVPWLRGRATWAAFVVALAGVSVLGYGFANVPVPSVAIPAVDVLLVATFAGLVVTGVRRPTPRLPFVAASALFCWASVRLVVDVPTWGSFALRDYTTYVELCALFAGYWLMERVGLERWLRALTWIFVVVTAYGLLQFYRPLFVTYNVLVGVQRPVPLLGFASGVASVSAFFYFGLFRPFGRRSLVLAAIAIAPLFLFQSRGLYLALPLAVALLTLQRGRTSAVRRLGAAAAIAAVAAAIVLTVQPAGRFGSTSPALLREQLLTLTGGAGVGDGSLNARTEWFSETLARVDAHPGALVVGLGLGPDLANGFSANGAILVRKPHDDFLEAFARLGLIGLSLVVLLLASALTTLIQGGRRLSTERERLFVQWVLANSVIYLFIAGTQPLLAYPYGTIPLFGILGAGLAVCAGRHRPAGSAP